MNRKSNLEKKIEIEKPNWNIYFIKDGNQSNNTM